MYKKCIAEGKKNRVRGSVPDMKVVERDIDAIYSNCEPLKKLKDAYKKDNLIHKFSLKHKTLSGISMSFLKNIITISLFETNNEIKELQKMLLKLYFTNDEVNFKHEKDNEHTLSEDEKKILKTYSKDKSFIIEDTNSKDEGKYAKFIDLLDSGNEPKEKLQEYKEKMKVYDKNIEEIKKRYSEEQKGISVIEKRMKNTAKFASKLNDIIKSEEYMKLKEEIDKYTKEIDKYTINKEEFNEIMLAY